MPKTKRQSGRRVRHREQYSTSRAGSYDECASPETTKSTNFDQEISQTKNATSEENNQQKLITQQFDAIQAAIGFLARKNTPCSLASIVQVANGVFDQHRCQVSNNGKASEGKSIDYNVIHQILEICPEVFQVYIGGTLCEVHDIYDTANPDEVTVALDPPGASKRAFTKRKQTFIRSLENHGVQDCPTPCRGNQPSPVGTTDTTQCHTDVKENPPTARKKSEAEVPSASFENIEKFLQSSFSSYEDQIAHVEYYEARPSKTCDIPSVVGQIGKELLEAKGISSLYQHQWYGIDAALQGNHVVMSTSTSSGKSLVYTLPILSGLIADPNSVALCLFPTKALAQDQLRSLKEFCDIDGFSTNSVNPACLDGDTPSPERKRIRKNANLLLSNPDIFHCSVLPNHSTWKRIISQLRYVVVDEAHVYKGIFGAHVAYVIRRLMRLCTVYGSNPQVFCCSATIGNPEEHFKNLVPLSETKPSREVVSVSLDTSPVGRKKFIVWNPPLLASNEHQISSGSSTGQSQKKRQKRHTGKTSSKTKSSNDYVMANSMARYEKDSSKEKHLYSYETDISVSNEHNVSGFMAPPSGATKNLLEQASVEKRRSPIVEAAELFSNFVRGGFRTIVFAKVRTVAELLLQYSIEHLERYDAKLIPLIKAYRGGYLKEHRRAIEKELFSGELLGVIATNALELGVDIGSLDAAILLGYPNSTSSLWQQAGRAGRRGKDSVVILVAYDSPIDQYFAKNPKHMLSRQPEDVVLNVNNATVMRQHVLCAAVENPLVPDDTAYFSARLGNVVKDLRDNNMLEAAEYTSEDFSGFSAWKAAGWVTHPAFNTSLRSIDDVVYKVLDVSQDYQCIDEIEEGRAYFQIHPGAIYMNQGRTYRVTKLDLNKREAWVAPSNVGYYTRSRDHSNVQALKRISSSTSGRTHFGPVQVETWVYGYRKISRQTGAGFELVDLSLPPIEYYSFGVWNDVTLKTKTYLDSIGLDFLGGCHAASHAVISVVPLYISCDRGDMGTECPYPFQERARPVRFIVYDSRPGGVGIADSIYRRARKIFQEALDLIENCGCEKGCPTCIHDEQCSEYNYVMDKKAACIILREAVFGDPAKSC